MKLAVISDTHFGAASRLVTPEDGAWVLGSDFDVLAAQVGTGNDYLVLVGDVFDFSVAAWKDAYDAARVFFRAVRARGLASQVVYLPGNHDFGFWHAAQYEANVVGRIRRFQDPTTRWTVPGLIEDRREFAEGLHLPNVSRREGAAPYGGLFLDALSVTSPTEEPLPFVVVYPNLYLVDREGRTTLITHGQYFEDYWSLTLEMARKVAGPDLRLDGRDTEAGFTMKDLVSVNFPLNVLASSGVGQAGPLTDVIRGIQADFREGRFDRIKAYVDNAFAWADERFGTKDRHLWGRVTEWFSDRLLAIARRVIVRWLRDQRDKRAGRVGRMKGTGRDNPAFPEEVAARIRTYLQAGEEEVGYLESSLGRPIPPPQALLFGHTHVPIEGRPLKERADITLFNTGGWLTSAKGALVFLYESEKGWRVGVAEEAPRPAAFAAQPRRLRGGPRPGASPTTPAAAPAARGRRGARPGT